MTPLTPPQSVTPPAAKVRRRFAIDSGRLQILIAVAAVLAIGLHGLLRLVNVSASIESYLSLLNLPLTAVLATGGLVLVVGLLRKLVHGEFGSDLLAGDAGRADALRRVGPRSVRRAACVLRLGFARTSNAFDRPP
jgi:hypothetical protein